MFTLLTQDRWKERVFRIYEKTTSFNRTKEAQIFCGELHNLQDETKILIFALCWLNNWLLSYRATVR